MAEPQVVRESRGGAGDVVKIAAWLISASVAVPVVASACAALARSLKLVAPAEPGRNPGGGAEVISLDAARIRFSGEENHAQVP